MEKKSKKDLSIAVDDYWQEYWNAKLTLALVHDVTAIEETGLTKSDWIGALFAKA